MTSQTRFLLNPRQRCGFSAGSFLVWFISIQLEKHEFPKELFAILEMVMVRRFKSLGVSRQARCPVVLLALALCLELHTIPFSMKHTTCVNLEYAVIVCPRWEALIESDVFPITKQCPITTYF